MRISDWSSDVCSSDLRLLVEAISVMNDGFVLLDEDDRLVLCNERYRCLHPGLDEVGDLVGMSFTTILRVALAKEIGRASCRERVCQYVSISVVAVSLKKKTHNTISYITKQYKL